MAGARVVLLFLFHALVFAACYAFAYLVRFEFNIPPEHLATFKGSFPIVVGTQLLIGFVFAFYRGWWRYVGMGDVVRLVFGLTTSLVILLGAWYAGTLIGLQERFVRSPRGVLLIDWAFALLFLFGSRVLIRLGRDHFRPANGDTVQQKRVLIIGAGDAGEALAREIEHRPQLGMKLVGFVDDQRAKWNSHIRGIKVTGPISDIAQIADAVNADEALLAIPSASGKRIREIIHHLSEADLTFKTMPGIDQIVSGKVHVSQLRPVNVEDLLRRARIDLPGDPVRELFKGKRVLVTGAGGTIGSELASQILEFGPQTLTLIERSEYMLYEAQKRLSSQKWSTTQALFRLSDIGNSEAMHSIIVEARPDIVLHAAAHKHVPLGEQNAAEYICNNTLATRALAEICSKVGVDRFILISTDKAINPTSVMGATKRAAEIVLLDLARTTGMKITIVRFGNVIGSSGSVIPLFLEQVANGGPVTVTHPDVTRYFIRTSEAISLVLQAATLGSGRDVFMLDMGEPLKIADLARDIIRLSNHGEAEIGITFTGLRPGEKLFEEISLKGESIRPTVHPQIVVTEPPLPGADQIRRWLEETSRLSPTAKPSHVMRLLSALIPEYSPTVETAAPPAAPAIDSKATDLQPSPAIT
ncbi:MAG TPA: nucleoside-diphosphate sugar epimerase/dehydratase [Thermoanaerobaculia bacterium]|nr:nucleoside-diphosphate sugar epimerase/dehydratase [Thermoanaerobaculia bacterium]